MTEIGQLLIKGVRECAQETPDYTYEFVKVDVYTPSGTFAYTDHHCQYMYEGQPSCIVGKAAFALGLIDASFEFSNSNRDTIPGFVKAIGAEIDESEATWLAHVQSDQDAGISWSEAVSEADDDSPDL
jgi:hypothetical protein